MKKTNFLLTSLVAATCLASATSAHAIVIIPRYDTATDQKYRTPAFKKQVKAACDLLGGYIGGSNNIFLTVTVSTTMNAGTFGTGAIDTSEAYENSLNRYRAKKGTVTFNSKFFDETQKEWSGNNISLMLHEIIHCLGFSRGIRAFDFRVDQNNFFFKGTAVKKVNNGNAFPLNRANDSSHFRDQVPDKVGVYPRMMAGGGNLLSILDLAVLSDLGYDVPVVTKAIKAVPLSFTLDSTFASKYRSVQWGIATSKLDGFAGDDTLTGDSAETLALFGNGGNDTLITGSEATVMCGDDMAAFDSGTDNADIYKITSNKTHYIMEFGANDKLQLSTKLNLTAAQVKSLTVENPPTKNQADIDFLNKNLPIWDYSSNSTSPAWYSPRKVTIGSLVFYCYAKNGPSGLTNDQLKARLVSNTSIND